jgi:hypothetical protein
MNEKRTPGPSGIRRAVFDTALTIGARSALSARTSVVTRPTVRRVPGLSAMQGDLAIAKALQDAIVLLETRRTDLARWDQATEQSFYAWFGTDDAKARDIVDRRIGRAVNTLRHLKVEDFIPIPKPTRRGKRLSTYIKQLQEWQSLFAYVTPGYTRPRLRAVAVELAIVHVGPEFATADDITRAGTIVHEVSHFESVGDTDDVSATFLGDPRKPGERQMYGYTKATRLSLQSSRKALKNADNFEFFIEGHDPADHALDLDGAGDFPTMPETPHQG